MVYCCSCVVSSVISLSSDAVISLVGPLPLSDPRNCRLEIRTGEGIGNLTVSLERFGNMEQKVGVVCYTDVPSDDYIPRINSLESLVYFEPNQTTTECHVEIIDDMINENTEKFSVYLGETVGLARVDQSRSPLCVFLTYDDKDGR